MSRVGCLALVALMLGAPIASLLVDWRVAGGSYATLAYVVLGFGALVSVANFYLSFLRHPVLRLLGRAEEDIRHVSGVPIFGAVVLVGLVLAPPSTALSVGCLLLLLLVDTGGPLWCLWAVWKDDGFFQ